MHFPNAYFLFYMSFHFILKILALKCMLLVHWAPLHRMCLPSSCSFPPPWHLSSSSPYALFNKKALCWLYTLVSRLQACTFILCCVVLKLKLKITFPLCQWLCLALSVGKEEALTGWSGGTSQSSQPPSVLVRIHQLQVFTVLAVIHTRNSNLIYFSVFPKFAGLVSLCSLKESPSQG